MEEAASVARTSTICLECGLATTGLKKSKESESSRKKLTKRQLALRCSTRYIQAHDLGGIAL